MAEMSSMMDVGGMDSAWTVGEWGYLTVMMVAMMLPSAAPPILLVARIGDILE
jgi:predicted metal-binding membrane protein